MARTSQVPSQPGMWSVKLHELLGRGERFLLVAEFEDRVATDHFLGLDERAVDDPQLAALNRTCAPSCSGISPPMSIMRPALISRSASLPIASISSGVGAFSVAGR